jgi:hypothetical protein
MKIAVYWKKYNGSHHKEIRHIFSFLFYALSELGYDFDIFNQEDFQSNNELKRAERKKYLNKDQIGYPRLLSTNSNLPNMPFEGKHLKTEYDLSIMFHTISDDKNVLSIKPGYLPGYFYFNPTGYSGWATIANNETEINNEKPNIDEFTNISKYTQNLNSLEKLPTKFIFSALQVSSDSVANQSLFTTKQMLSKTISIAKSLNLSVVIKKHPKDTNTETDKMLDDLSRKNKFVHISTNSIHFLIEKSTCVFIINSGVGFEALLKGKPVFSFGKSDYSHLTFSVKADSSHTEVKNFIEEHSKQNNHIERAHQFLRKNFIKIGDISAIQKNIEKAIYARTP